MRYSASLDKTTKLLTIGLTLFLLGVIVFEVLTFSSEATVGIILLSPDEVDAFLHDLQTDKPVFS